MGQLIVVAEVTEGAIVPASLAHLENIQGHFLVVSVTGTDGHPVNDLTDDNFEIHIFRGGGGMSSPKFEQLGDSHTVEHLPGVYLIAFRPFVPSPKASEKFIYTVAVSKVKEGDRVNSHYGQTLTSFMGLPAS